MSKVWIITGAGSGIGTGIANAALRAGDRVVATGRNLEKVRSVLDAAPENIAFVQLDVANEAEAKAAVDEAMQRFGASNLWLQNAGYSLLGNFEEITSAEIHKSSPRTSMALSAAMQAALPGMRGSVRATSSTSVPSPARSG